MADSPDDICTICGNTRQWHLENGPKHSFSGDAGSLNEDEPKTSTPVAVRRGLGGDPALRLALLNAGVITAAQLMAAEEELDAARASGSIVVPGGNAVAYAATPIDGSGTPEDPVLGDRGGS